MRSCGCRLPNPPLSEGCPGFTLWPLLRHPHAAVADVVPAGFETCPQLCCTASPRAPHLHVHSGLQKLDQHVHQSLLASHSVTWHFGDDCTGAPVLCRPSFASSCRRPRGRHYFSRPVFLVAPRPSWPRLSVAMLSQNGGCPVALIWPRVLTRASHVLVISLTPRAAVLFVSCSPEPVRQGSAVSQQVPCHCHGGFLMPEQPALNVL